jgi:hypothetical protein
MKHLKTFAIFEGNMQDSLYLESLLTSTIEGRDLEKVVRGGKWGNDWYNANYRTPKTGSFYISERYSEIKIEKLPNGKWGVTTKTKANIDLGEYDTAEEALRAVWAYLIIKNGIPTGVKQKDYTKWLLDPNCPVWGKALKKNDIDDEYIKSLRSSGPPMVESIEDIFTSKEWQDKFDLLGVNPTRSEGSFNLAFTHYNIDRGNIFFLFAKSIDADYFSKNTKSLNIKLSNTKGYKAKVLNGYYLEIVIGDESIEAIENKTMSRYLKELDKSTDDPVSKMIAALLSGPEVNGEIRNTLIKGAADVVSKEPSILAKISDSFRSEVAAEAGFTDSEVNGIKNASDFGII